MPCPQLSHFLSSCNTFDSHLRCIGRLPGLWHLWPQACMRLMQVQVSAQQAQKNVKQSAARIRGAAKGAVLEEPEKKQNPLAWLGIGQESVYADDD